MSHATFYVWNRGNKNIWSYLFLFPKQNSKIIKKKLKNMVTHSWQSGNGVGRDRRGIKLLNVIFYISFYFDHMNKLPN